MRPGRTKRAPLTPTPGALAALLLAAGCAVNPATGERQLSLISESQEIQMGREADPDVTASIGLYDDPALQAYVAELGNRLAAVSERPSLPWSFKVVDDDVVNAFAIPGGFIYVTRGILANFDSEAELVGVLGHEIGHVTARHSVSQMSRQQLQQIGLGVGMILSEDVRRFGDVAMAGLQLLNLSYSRGDESQADELGFRYMTRVGYDPHALEGVFQMLASQGGGGGRIPEWQLTHPHPENREANIRQLIARSGQDFSDATVAADAYLRRLDGMIYGPNPREGYFKANAFYHPDLAFHLDFPPGWQTVNQKTAVAGVAPSQQAIFVLTVESGAASHGGALAAFLGQEGIRGGRVRDGRINGLPAAWAPFTATTQDGTLQGQVAFIQHGSNIYRLLGYAAQANWSRYAPAVDVSIQSFEPVTDQAVLSVQPARLNIVELPESMTMRDFLARYPSTRPEEEMTRLNRRGLDESVSRGTLLRQVSGGEIP